MGNKKIYITMLLFLLGAFIWHWKYSNLNSQYDMFSDIEVKYFQKGETVPFGQDFLASRVCVDGYSIRVDDFAIYDYKRFAEENSITISEDGVLPGKIALVNITLTNEKSTADGVPLTDLKLHGVDSYALIDRTLFVAINPALQGAYGIRLNSESEFQIKLPFALFERQYRYTTWAHLDEHQFFLRVTAFPVVKEVELQR